MLVEEKLIEVWFSLLDCCVQKRQFVTTCKTTNYVVGFLWLLNIATV